MRRSASKIIRNLEMRIARLERKAIDPRRENALGLPSEEAEAMMGLNKELTEQVALILSALNHFYKYSLSSSKLDKVRKTLAEKVSYDKRTGDFLIEGYSEDARLVEGTLYDGGEQPYFMICLDAAEYSKRKVGQFDWIVTFHIIHADGRRERLAMLHNGDDYKAELKRALFVGRRASVRRRTARDKKSMGALVSALVAKSGKSERDVKRAIFTHLEMIFDNYKEQFDEEYEDLLATNPKLTALVRKGIMGATLEDLEKMDLKERDAEDFLLAVHTDDSFAGLVEYYMDWVR